MLYFDLIISHLHHKQIIMTDLKNNYTYEKIDHLCIKISAALKKCGVQTGDRVVLLAEHTTNIVIVILACMRMGVCFIPLSPEISISSLEYLVLDAAPALLIGKYQLQSIKCISIEELFAMDESQEICQPAMVNENTISYILYTSGSTGNPKGVVASEKSVKFCIEAINRRLENNASDRILCCLPISFDYGLYQIFLCLFSEACLILPPVVPLPQIVSILAKEQITGFPAMPAMLNMLLKTRLLDKVTMKNLRYITSTGDNFPIDLIKHISSAIPSAEIIPMYGLTECKRVSVMPMGCTNKVLAGSCGLPLDGVKVWLEHQDNTGMGELIISGENVMNGYWNDEKTTQEKFFLNEKNEKCLRSGDFFRIDSEGYLYFIGRKHTVLKANGYRIGVLELENLILSEMNTIIEELAVTGYPDEMIGEKIAVCIFSVLSKKLIIDKLKEVSEKLSPYQRPHMLFFFDKPLPKSQNGKIDRNELKEMILHHEYIFLR